MNKKIVLIFLLIVVLGMGFISLSFYNQKVDLNSKNIKLKEEILVLTDENNKLEKKYSAANKEKLSVLGKLDAVREEVEMLSEEVEGWRNKYDKLAAERDMLAKAAKPSIKEVQIVEVKSEAPKSSDGEENTWADFIQKKAFLEAKVSELEKNLLDLEDQIAKLAKENKELGMKIDDQVRQKEALVNDIKMKARALQVMSMDLVNERESRSEAFSGLEKLRDENTSLKREIVMTNKEKIDLQEKLRKAVERKEDIERRIMEAESILKEKSLAFTTIKNQVSEAIRGEGRIEALESQPAAVELPPIVVKQEVAGSMKVKGEVIAVNREEDFVVLDIGEASGIRPGDSLKVLRNDKVIATLEVIETRKDISAADIKEIDSGVVIKENDLVVGR